MTPLDKFVFNWRACEAEYREFSQLLAKEELSEGDDIQPFFKPHVNLAAYIGTCTAVGIPDRLRFEFEVGSSFTVDLLIGNSKRKTYCAIEFEDARRPTVFRKAGRATLEWGQRLEHGFGQIIDWFCHLDGQRRSEEFFRDFGYEDVTFIGMVLAGRSTGMSNYDRHRLDWRSAKVVVNHAPVYCRTFDWLYEDFQTSFALLSRLAGTKHRGRSDPG